MKKIIYILTLSLFVTTFSCTTEDLEPTLAQVKEVEGNINSDEDMFGLLKGALNRVTASAYYGREFIINNEVRTLNCFPNGSSGRFQTQANYDYGPSNDPGCWDDAYRVIAVANILVNTDVANLSGDVGYAEHIRGQALFLRALAHFDLMKNYGQQYLSGGSDLGVSIVTQFKDGEPLPPRSSVSEVKQFIYDDLEMAFNTMDDQYNISAEYPTKMAARALQSRVATYFGDWSTVVSASEAVMNSGQYSILDETSFVSSFAQDNSANSIFELAYSDIDNLGNTGLGFIYRGDAYGDVEVMPNVHEIFANSDIRGLNPDGNGTPQGILGYEGDMLRNMGKYPSLLGYDNVPVIRFEEIILNYAEALMRLGQGDPASELNKITSNRGASSYSNPVTEDDILSERRKELMFEGFYFDDLVRMGRELPVKSAQIIDEYLPAGADLSAFAIPIAEMDANSNMQQNPGYN